MRLSLDRVYIQNLGKCFLLKDEIIEYAISTAKFGKINGKSKLIIIRGTVNSQKYQEIIAEALPSMKSLYPRGFVLIEDNAPCHKSKSTRQWKIRTTEWPPASPDLNPIEAVWNLMKRQVERELPKN